MDYELIENITHADIAVRVRGSSLDELFVKGGIALVSEMVENSESVSPVVEKRGEIKGESPELLYFGFLNEILFFKDAEGILLMPVKITVIESHGEYRCLFLLSGEKINRDKHQFRVDIKGVTMHGLRLYFEDGVFIAESVFDV